MGRDHHHLLGVESQQIGRRQIDLRIGLVAARELRRQHRVPRDAGVLRHVDEQRHVPVRQRRQHVARPQAGQPFHGVRPRRQAVPGPVQVVELFLGEAFQPVPRRQFVQDHPVQVVDLRPAQLATAHPSHRGSVTRPPVVRERGPVRLDALRAPDCRALAGDARPPVDDGAEDVERHRADPPDAAVRLLPRRQRRERRGARERRGRERARSARQKLPPSHRPVPHWHRSPPVADASSVSFPHPSCPRRKAAFG